MDEDTVIKTWVLVNEVDCAEETLSLHPTISTAIDSDQESDGSISIISDHPPDSYSEEEHEPVTVSDIKPIIPVVTVEAAPEINEEENTFQFSESESTASKEELNVSECCQENKTGHENNECLITSSSDIVLKKKWTYLDKKSQFEGYQEPYSLDYSQEPIFEASQTDIETTCNTENISSNLDFQRLLKTQETIITKISNKETSREGTFNRIGIGILLSIIVLVGSYLIQQYDENKDDKIQTRSERFLEGLVDYEKAKEIINFCMDRQKSKGEYSERTVEKCVVKRLRNKNRKEEMERTEKYLQMKERMLEIREKELNDKEKQVLEKWWKDQADTSEKNEKSNKDKIISKISYSEIKKKNPERSFQESDKNYKKQLGFNEKKRSYHHTEKYFKKGHKNNKDKSQFFHEKYNENFQSSEVSDKKHKKHILDNNQADKKIFKQDDETIEMTLKTIKEKIKKFYQKDNKKHKLKKYKGDKKQGPSEEWYIKYNPTKNTIELINITKLTPEDSLLIRNGNKTINGQWYFSLYGDSRNYIRNKEKIAEWYFKRGHYRDIKRDKAKWYFDYMSGRNRAKYF